MTDRYTRRIVLQAGGAAVVTGLAGCLGGDDGPGGLSDGGPLDSGLDLELGERPLKYVMAPEALQDDGLVPDQPVNAYMEVPAGYYDLQRIRESLQPEAWENAAPIYYPPEILMVKHGAGSAWKVEETETIDDVESVMYGKSNETLIRTTVGHDDLAALMEEQGFSKRRDRDGWEIFEGPYDDGRVTTEMRAALNDDLVAAVIAESAEPVRGQVPNRFSPQDLDRFIDTYTDFLNEDAPAASALSETNDNARQAEIMYADQFDDRTWEAVAHYRFPEGDEAYDVTIDDELPVDFMVALTDFEDRERVVMNYHWFENGTERKTYWPSVDLVDEVAEGGEPEVTYPNSSNTG